MDVRYAFRALVRAPAFTITALLTVALGIGATTAIFSVVNAVLLQPPPYPEPDRLFTLTTPDLSAQSGQVFHGLRHSVRAFENVAAFGGGTGWNLVAGTRAEYVEGLPVSRAYFEVFGIRPLLGRAFTEAEEHPNGPRAVVLSETLWRRLFGARPDAIGEVIQLGGVAHSIVGIMPAGFQSIPPAALWTPLQLSPDDDSWNYTIVGRLRRDATPAQAAGELDALRATIRMNTPGISERRLQALHWMPYQRALGLSMRGNLLLLLGAVAFLLLIACVNVASLQLVRAVARRGEMATRAALGSGTTRLLRQVLTESVVLALGGGALGVLCAAWGTQALLTFVPSAVLGTRKVGVDATVLAVTLGLSLASGVLFGIAPALGAARLDVRAVLWSGGRHTPGPTIMWLRRSFMVLEIALAVVLLVGAGLLIRTFVNLRGADPGFIPDDVVIGSMSLQGSPDQAQGDAAAFFERTLERVRTVPGVVAAAVGNNVPIERGLNLAVHPPAGALIDQVRAVDWRYVTSEYFDVFRIPLRSGRVFDSRDRADTAPVAIVNEAFASAYFGDAAVIGRSLRVATSDDSPLLEIVGVVGDVKGRSGSGWTHGPNALGTPAPPAIYVPVAQVPRETLRVVHHYFPVSWALRTREASPALVASVQQVLQSAAPQLPFIRFTTMDELMARDVETERFLMLLLLVFAAAAMVLAATGMYGLTAYTASQRIKEVGIRIAVGATANRVLGAFLAEALVLGAAGLVLGLGAAVLLARVVASIVFGISPHDPATYAAAAVILLGTIGAASLVPAVRASRIDPVAALRSE